MALYDGLCGRDESGVRDESLQTIAIDQFSALLIEYTFGAVTRQDIINNLSLTIAEEVDLDLILAKGTNQAQRRELYTRIKSILHLAEGNHNGYGLPSQLQSKIEAI